MLATLAPPVEALLAVERPRLERLARRLVWNDEDAKDVVQAALVDALARWHTLRDGGAAPGFLRRVVVNRAISHLRRRRLWAAVTGLLSANPEADTAPDEAADQRQHLAQLGRALEALPPRQATAFSLRYLEGLSIDEVAEALGIERGTVRVHLQRAVKALRARGVLPPGDQGRTP